MRSKLARLLAACLLVAVMLSSAMPLVFADTDLEIGGLAIVANTGGDAVMVRDGAGYDFTVLLSAEAGTIVTVTDGPYSGDDGALWYEVNVDGTIGYIFASFLVLPENAPANPVRSSSQRVRSSDGYSATVSGTGGDGARMRDSADLDAAIILVIPEGEDVSVIDSPGYSDGYAWYPVVYAGETGWVAGIFLGDGSAPAVQAATTTAPRNSPVFESGAHVQVMGTGGDDLRIRETYGLDGDIYGHAPSGAVVQILNGPNWDGAGNAWYAIDYDGLSGYANASYLSWTSSPLSGRSSGVTATAPVAAAEAAPQPKSAPAAAAAPASSGSRGQAIVNVAMRYLGYAYVWAGATPSGFDCSGFTMYVLNLALGINIGHSLGGQVSSGVAVSSKNLEPGDLVFFENTYEPGLSHVGIYIGGGQMIHAGSERTGVVISNIWDSYWGPKYYAARRIG